jgi:hypothetical protein
VPSAPIVITAEAPVDAETPATRESLAALGLEPGTTIGALGVAGVTGPKDGAILIHTTSPAGDTTYEIRLLSEQPRPAARTPLYSIYYRGAVGPGRLEGAAALANVIAHASPEKPPPPGLTTYPTDPR